MIVIFSIICSAITSDSISLPLKITPVITSDSNAAGAFVTNNDTKTWYLTFSTSWKESEMGNREKCQKVISEYPLESNHGEMLLFQLCSDNSTSVHLADCLKLKDSTVITLWCNTYHLEHQRKIEKRVEISKYLIVNRRLLVVGN